MQAAFYGLWGLALTSWSFYFAAQWNEARPAVLLAVIYLIISGWGWGGGAEGQWGRKAHWVYGCNF